MKTSAIRSPLRGLVGLNKSVRLFAVLLTAAIVSPLARAATDEIFNIGGDSSEEGDQFIDLNSYSVTTITSIYVQGGADAASPEEYETVSASAGAALGFAYSSDSNSGLANASAHATVFAINITKDGFGHWIAESVTTNDGTYYDVDLGTGEIELAASGSANGPYSGASAYASITY